VGSSTGKPESSPTQAPPSPPSSLPTRGGLSTALDAVVSAADREIEAMKKRYSNPMDLPDEFISLNKKLHFEVIPALRGKTLLEIRQVLADFCQREAGTQLSTVLEEMFNAAVRMS
jgi:hypothetical protein